MSFTNIKAYEATDETRDYKFNGLVISGKTPVLVVKHAGGSNEAYNNAFFKVHAKKMATMQRKKKVDFNKAESDEAKQKNIRLYANYVVCGWRDVVADDGSEPQFTVEQCIEFLSAIPNAMFNDFADFVTDPDNFVDESAIESVMTATERAKAVKNSKGSSDTSSN